MVLLQDINTSQWSQALAGPGLVVTDLEDIKQCLYIIVATRKGSAPFWFDFGCSLFDWLDEPMTVAAPKIARDIRASIAQWEPRAIVEEVTFSFQPDGSAFFNVHWHPVAGTKAGASFSTEFGLNQGSLYLVDNYNRNVNTEFGSLEL